MSWSPAWLRSADAAQSAGAAVAVAPADIVDAVTDVEGAQVPPSRACDASPASADARSSDDCESVSVVSEAQAVDPDDVRAVARPGVPAERVWSAVSTAVAREDEHGYGRIPAFWFTLNCPYNYLHELHRFHCDDGSLRGMDQKSRNPRTLWCHDHPDLVCFLHALRVELLVRMVIAVIVPTSSSQPFHYWVRFEEGQSGNPHVHGLGYAAGNPSLCGIESAGGREGNVPEEDSRSFVANDLAKYFSDLVSEKHPAKNEGGEKLYDFHIENLNDCGLGNPNTIDLGSLLGDVLGAENPDLTPLKKNHRRAHRRRPAPYYAWARRSAEGQAPVRKTRSQEAWPVRRGVSLWLSKSLWRRRRPQTALCVSTRCDQGCTICCSSGTIL